MAFHVGQTFGDYSITGLLGAGGMGQVYKVEHRLTQRTEAMKVLAAEFATDIQILRFEREMRVLARLSHPNIAVLHNAIHSEKQLILFMEFVDGRTLESVLSAGRLPIDTGIGYIKQILSALRYAHQQGVVHRDVTPANVIVTADGEVKLTDFGLSKSFGDPLLTNCGEILGALPYLAPEQLKGVTQPDQRSDLYSVGAILYEHLTGQKPFGADRRLAAVITDSEAEPQPPSQLEPSLANKWDEIIRRALARNPEHRYQSAGEFLDAIAQLDEAAVAELPLPRLRTMGVGVAIFAGLVLALVASPELNSLRPVAPLTAPFERMHIAPPDFATALAAPELPPPPPPPPAPRKRIVRSAKAIAAVADTDTEPPAAPVAESADPAAPTPAPAQPKRTFWSKMNVFKKKRAAASGVDSNEKP
jgi:eukaryotic-like serine/threonine-protein kinase